MSKDKNVLPMTATVHVGPNGGTEYRLWSSADTYRVVSKFKALPHMSVDERDKSAALEQDRKTALKAKADADTAWRSITRR